MNRKKLFLLLKKNIKLVGISSISDFMFFLAFSFATLSFFSKIKENIESIYQIIAEQSTAMQKTPTLETMSSILTTQNQFMQYFNEIIYQAIIYTLILFAAWLVFQGLSWFIAQKIVKKKVNVNEFTKHFAAVSSLGLIGVLIIVLGSIKVSASMTSSVVPLISQQTLNGLVTVLFVIVLYLLMITYALLPKKNWHKSYLKKVYSYPLQTGGTFVVSAIILVALNYSMMRLVAVHWALFLVFTIFLVLPSYTILRVYWITMVSSLKAK